MTNTLRLCLAAVLCLFVATIAHASFVPVSVYPNPVAFGTISENTTGYQIVYISNTTASSVVITAATISGTNASDFAFYGGNCVGTLSAYQTCQTTISFTPLATGSLSASLVISIQGLTQQVTALLEGTGGNPPPVITSLSPANAYVNSPQLTLTVNGTGFQSGAIVYWGNINPLATTFVSSTKITAVVPASDLNSINTDWIAVANPDGQSSAIAYFYVLALDPSINYVSPTSVTAATAPSPIIVNGSNFMTGASILWNGIPLATTYLSTGQLQATPSSAQLASAAIVQLSVSNPSPGGISNEMNFDVTYPAKTTVLDLPANDLVWDPYAQRIYASLPSSYGTNGNSIAVINPTTAKVTGYYFAGSEPNQLALSSDSKYLYVGLNGNGTVQRLILPAFTPDITINLGTSTYGGFNNALSMQVSPGDSHTIAVAEGSTSCCGGSSGLYFFKDATQLADSITYPAFTDIVFANSSTLYGYYSGTVGQVTVNSSGGTLGSQWNSLVEGNSIEYAAGLIYGSNGEVLNPSTGLLVGSYDTGSSGCCGSAGPLQPDSAINRVFSLGTTPFFNGLGVTAYNLSRFTPVAVTNLSQLSGSPSQVFIFWGNSGVAFTFSQSCCYYPPSQTVLVQSSSMLLTSSTAKNPVPVAQSLSPSSATHGSGNLLVTITGTSFVPGSQVTWNGAALYASYVSSTQLNLYVPARDLASAGTATIVVTNPAPGGGKSTAPAFTIQ